MTVKRDRAESEFNRPLAFLSCATVGPFRVHVPVRRRHVNIVAPACTLPPHRAYWAHLCVLIFIVAISLFAVTKSAARRSWPCPIRRLDRCRSV